MSRTHSPRPLVSTDGRADARGSVVVSHDVARAALAALAGLTPHPWLGVIDEGSGWTEADLPPARSLVAALVGVPSTPEAIMQAHAVADAAAELEDGVNQTPNVRSLGGGRFEWRPLNGGERVIVLHFRAEDAVISWRSTKSVRSCRWEELAPNPRAVAGGAWDHRSRFIGRVVAWASPRSVAVAPMAGHSGPVRSI